MEENKIFVCPVIPGLKREEAKRACEEIVKKIEKARRVMIEKARDRRIKMLEGLHEFNIGDKVIGYFDVGYEEHDLLSHPVSGIITEIIPVSNIPGDVEYYVVNKENELYSGFTERRDTIEYDEEIWNKIKQEYESIHI